LLHFLRHVAQRPAREFHLQVDVARAVVAVHHGRAATELQLRHLAQQHRPLAARHRQAFEQGQVLARTILQLDHDGHLARCQVELGQATS
jgi:hypothetical protein